MNKLRVGVIFGGRSGEHEISLRSAESVLQALDPAKYEAVPIGITHEGKWLTSKESCTDGAIGRVFCKTSTRRRKKSRRLKKL